MEIPVFPRRCDHFRLALSGVGGAVVYSIAGNICCWAKGGGSMAVFQLSLPPPPNGGNGFRRGKPKLRSYLFQLTEQLRYTLQI